MAPESRGSEGNSEPHNTRDTGLEREERTLRNGDDFEQDKDDAEDEDVEDEDAEDEDAEDEEEEPQLKYASLTRAQGALYRNADAASAFLVAGDKMVGCGLQGA